MAFIGRGIKTVRTDGNQTIDGVKTFNSAITFNNDTTFNNAIKLANNTWNICGDDAFFGDVNISGSVGFKSGVAIVSDDLNYITKIVQQGDGNFVFYKNDVAILGTSISNPQKIYAPNNNDVDDYGSIVTNQGVNKSGNGHVKFSNGIIAQWGRNNVSSGGTINFPTPFPSGNYGVSPVIYDANVDSNVNCYDLATTTFKIKIEGGGTRNIAWVAIGY